MPITSLLLAELPGSVEALDLAHVQADITRRQVAALAVWRAEQYLRAWKTYAVEYDVVLQLGNKTPSSDPTTRKNQKSSMMRGTCQDIEKVANHFGYPIPGLVDRLIFLYDYDLDEALGRSPQDQGPQGGELGQQITAAPTSSSVAVTADGSVPSVVAASSSSSNGLQGTVAGNESYWFKRLDARMASIAQSSRETAQAVTMTTMASALTALAETSSRMESLMIMLIEESRGRSSGSIEDGDGGSQVLSSEGEDSD
ncbi:hypothetical protein FOZ63_011001, partial [Perkinsus olseni]